VAYVILEHTADVGVRASGGSLVEAFREVTLGMLEITGTWAPNGGEEVHLEFTGDDPGSLVVDWLSEILYLQDARDAVVSGVTVEEADDTKVSGTVKLSPRGDVVPEGTAVKAITYHQLSVGLSEDGWTITVFVDV
jgi:SHS2 domain-containing protein